MSNPYDFVESIYNGLSRVAVSDGYKDISRNAIKRYCENLEGYQKNQFDAQKLNDELLDEIWCRWNVQFERYGYSREPS